MYRDTEVKRIIPPTTDKGQLDYFRTHPTDHWRYFTTTRQAYKAIYGPDAFKKFEEKDLVAENNDPVQVGGTDMGDPIKLKAALGKTIWCDEPTPEPSHEGMVKMSTPFNGVYTWVPMSEVKANTLTVESLAWLIEDCLRKVLKERE